MKIDKSNNTFTSPVISKLHFFFENVLQIELKVLKTAEKFCIRQFLKVIREIRESYFNDLTEFFIAREFFSRLKFFLSNHRGKSTE